MKRELRQIEILNPLAVDVDIKIIGELCNPADDDAFGAERVIEEG